VLFLGIPLPRERVRQERHKVRNPLPADTRRSVVNLFDANHVSAGKLYTKIIVYDVIVGFVVIEKGIIWMVTIAATMESRLKVRTGAVVIGRRAILVHPSYRVVSLCLLAPYFVR
jgi:hypothetical protein